MRTIVHIGQHKTGTTSIQHYLRNKRGELASAGLYVPDSLAGYDNPSQFILNVYALAQHRSSPMKDELSATRSPDFFAGLQENLERDILGHYQLAHSQGCKDVIWSNEGLYLLNSAEEYKRLRSLFDGHSTEVWCICCFREIEAYRNSYIRQLKKQGIQLNADRDSYRYVDADSWLFDYERKMNLLREVFEKTIFFDYEKDGMVFRFMEKIGYSMDSGDEIRLNVS